MTGLGSIVSDKVLVLSAAILLTIIYLVFNRDESIKMLMHGTWAAFLILVDPSHIHNLRSSDLKDKPKTDTP